MKAVDLLAPGGTLLAILPSSIVASQRGQALRAELFARGTIRAVHELPHFTFARIEARVYLLIFQRRPQRRPVLLLNHRLYEPSQLEVVATQLQPELRLDYGFHFANRWFRELIDSFPNGDWLPLSAVSDISRGRAASPRGCDVAIHTSDFADGFWNTERLRRAHSRSKEPLKRTDIIMARVGRKVLSAVGLMRRAVSVDATDCLLRVRPKRLNASAHLLFSLRSILGMMELEDLLVRGAGAKYVVEADLASLRIPRALPQRFPKLFARYQAMIRRRDFGGMLACEEAVQRRLRERIKRV